MSVKMYKSITNKNKTKKVALNRYFKNKSLEMLK